MATYARLLRLALDRVEDNRTRVVVQVGHCSQAVGAREVADALRSSLAGRSDVHLVATGCDGACFAAPQVLVVHPSGETQRFTRVTAEDAELLAGTLPRADSPTRSNDWAGGSDHTPQVVQFLAGQHRLLLTRCGVIDPASLDEYLAVGGYQGLDNALSMPGEQVIDTVLESGLLGRGGAYFPAAQKWRAARAAGGSQRYMVVNAEEGEPGLFKDRHIMEGDPHRLLEGMLIGAYAAGASHGYLYINAEAGLSSERMEQAIHQAREAGLVGEDVLGRGFSFEVEIRRGAGGYVCGEETTLLDTIQGERREPRLRPPFPTESGLFQRPTVINNVETLANVPTILATASSVRGEESQDVGAPASARGEPVEPEPANSRNEIPPGAPLLKGGMEGFVDVGIDSAKGTKLICLSGAIQRPGLAEVPMATTLHHVIHEIGGGPLPGHSIDLIAAGGPSSGVLPASAIDATLQPGPIHPSGVVMGGGGIVALEDVSVIDVVRRMAAYNAAESCGKCTPCREGTPRMVEILDRLASSQGKPTDLDELAYLSEIVGSASLCGLGQMAGGPINSALHSFWEEMEKLVGGA